MRISVKDYPRNKSLKIHLSCVPFSRNPHCATPALIASYERLHGVQPGLAVAALTPSPFFRLLMGTPVKG